MTFKKSYVPGILGSVLTLTVIMAAPVKAETKEETILNKTDWSTMAAANVEGYANIRSEANADSEIVGVLMPGYAVTVTEKGDEWSKISSNGVEGYIKNEYLVFGEEAKAHYRNMCGITGVVQADSLRVREAASTDSAQVGTLVSDPVQRKQRIRSWRLCDTFRGVKRCCFHGGIPGITGLCGKQRSSSLHSRQCIGNFRRQQ